MLERYRWEWSRKNTGDCVCRSIAIVAQLPYDEVYRKLAAGMGSQRRSKRMIRRGKPNVASARNGVSTRRLWFKDYMHELGFRWVATMGIGTGCKVHLRDGELPMGRIIVRCSRHYTAVIDGVIHDTHDPSRDGERCVYGYWTTP